MVAEVEEVDSVETAPTVVTAPIVVTAPTVVEIANQDPPVAPPEVDVAEVAPALKPVRPLPLLPSDYLQSELCSHLIESIKTRESRLYSNKYSPYTYSWLSKVVPCHLTQHIFFSKKGFWGFGGGRL